MRVDGRVGLGWFAEVGGGRLVEWSGVECSGVEWRGYGVEWSGVGRSGVEWVVGWVVECGVGSGEWEGISNGGSGRG